MAELSFTEHDGELHLQIGPAVARLEGRGKFSFSGPVYGRSSRFSLRARGARLRIFQRIAAIASAVLFVVVAALLAWRWFRGGETPAVVSISAEVASLALLGSLFSLGGVSLLSVQGALAAEGERIEALQQRCPFESVSLGRINNGREPGNPEFCVKCPLGIDTVNDRRRDFLMHSCAVYEQLHHRWRETPAGREYIRRRGPEDDV